MYSVHVRTQVDAEGCIRLPGSDYITLASVLARLVCEQPEPLRSQLLDHLKRLGITVTPIDTPDH